MTKETIREICRAAAYGFSVDTIAQEMGISAAEVSDLISINKDIYDEYARKAGSNDGSI